MNAFEAVGGTTTTFAGLKAMIVGGIDVNVKRFQVALRFHMRSTIIR
jgi:hypothetical protein